MYLVKILFALAALTSFFLFVSGNLGVKRFLPLLAYSATGFFAYTATSKIAFSAAFALIPAFSVCFLLLSAERAGRNEMRLENAKNGIVGAVFDRKNCAVWADGRFYAATVPENSDCFEDMPVKVVIKSKSECEICPNIR